MEIKSWWEVAQLAGIGGCVILIPGIIYLWKAYQSELSYSKKRDRETLEMMHELTGLLKGVTESQSGSRKAAEEHKKSILDAIEKTHHLIEQHLHTVTDIFKK